MNIALLLISWIPWWGWLLIIVLIVLSYAT
jgi:hypothetical protein